MIVPNAGAEVRPLDVDIVSDVICPWCFIGVTRLEQALAEEGESANLAFHPFELDPHTPAEGVDLRTNLARKYGGDPEAMFARVEEVARECGLAIDFGKVRKSVNTAKAHALIAAAGPRGIQLSVVKALFEAYFIEGRDVGDAAVLVDVAVSRGFDLTEAQAIVEDEAAVEAARLAAREASAQGVRGVPFFVFDQRFAVSGGQPVEVFRKALVRARGET